MCGAFGAQVERAPEEELWKKVKIPKDKAGEVIGHTN